MDISRARESETARQRDCRTASARTRTLATRNEDRPDLLWSFLVREKPKSCGSSENFQFWKPILLWTFSARAKAIMLWTFLMRVRAPARLRLRARSPAHAHVHAHAHAHMRALDLRWGAGRRARPFAQASPGFPGAGREARHRARHRAQNITGRNAPTIGAKRHRTQRRPHRAMDFGFGSAVRVSLCFGAGLRGLARFAPVVREAHRFRRATERATGRATGRRTSQGATRRQSARNVTGRNTGLAGRRPRASPGLYGRTGRPSRAQDK